jgi:hypothetical protein
VNDFWGAIAIGFVTAYASSQIFQRLLPSSNLPKPIIDEIIASPGSLKLHIRGHYLSPKAKFQIDHEAISPKVIPEEPEASDNQTQG